MSKLSSFRRKPHPSCMKIESPCPKCGFSFPLKGMVERTPDGTIVEDSGLWMSSKGFSQPMYCPSCKHAWVVLKST